MHTRSAFTVAGQSPVRTGFTDHSEILEMLLYTFFSEIQAEKTFFQAGAAESGSPVWENADMDRTGR